MSKNQRIPHAKRTEISDSRMLQAAIELIVERGPELTTLKDVGEMAGYSRGLAGYRFGNKAGLFDFVIRAVGGLWLEELKKATDGLTGFDAIAAAIDAHCQMCMDTPDYVAAFYILWFGAIGPQSEVRSVIANIHERRRRDVIQWIKQDIERGKTQPDIDADAIANQFITSITGISYQWLLNPKNVKTIEAAFLQMKKSIGLWFNTDDK